MIQQPHIMKKARDELNDVILKPFLQQNTDFKGRNVMEAALNYENMWELKYFTSCFLESLRREPPVTVSSACTLTEDLTI